VVEREALQYLGRVVFRIDGQRDEADATRERRRQPLLYVGKRSGLARASARAARKKHVENHGFCAKISEMERAALFVGQSCRSQCRRRPTARILFFVAGVVAAGSSEQRRRRNEDDTEIALGEREKGQCPTPGDTRCESIAQDEFYTFGELLHNRRCARGADACADRFTVRPLDEACSGVRCRMGERPSSGDAPCWVSRRESLKISQGDRELCERERTSRFGGPKECSRCRAHGRQREPQKSGLARLRISRSPCESRRLSARAVRMEAARDLSCGASQERRASFCRERFFNCRPLLAT